MKKYYIAVTDGVNFWEEGMFYSRENAENYCEMMNTKNQKRDADGGFIGWDYWVIER